MSKMQDDLLDYNLVVVGKTGSGKSWVCNRLLGSRDCRGPFRVFNGMEGQTIMAQSEVVRSRRNRRLHVIDTPDVFNLGEDDAGAERRFIAFPSPSSGPIAFLFIVRLDLRFTPNDYQLYKRYRELLPRHLRNNVILGFTRVDNLPGPVEEQITLSSVQTFLNDCQRRYVTFTVPKAELAGDREQVEQIVEKIMGWMTKMPSKMSCLDRVLARLMSRASWMSLGTRAIAVSGTAAFVFFTFIYTRRDPIRVCSHKIFRKQTEAI